MIGSEHCEIRKDYIKAFKNAYESTIYNEFGTVDEKELLLIEAKDKSGITGWGGETVAFVAPWYTEETLKTTWHMLQDFLIPILLHKEIGHPDEVTSLFAPIRRNCMAKASIEGAVWDIYAQQTKQSLAQALGGQKKRIEVGVSVGIQPSVAQLIALIKDHIEKGYKRVKIKIKPGEDVEVVRAIRAELPNLPLM